MNDIKEVVKYVNYLIVHSTGWCGAVYWFLSSLDGEPVSTGWMSLSIVITFVTTSTMFNGFAMLYLTYRRDRHEDGYDDMGGAEVIRREREIMLHSSGKSQNIYEME